MQTLKLFNLEAPIIFHKGQSIYLQTKAYPNHSVYEFNLQDASYIPYIFNNLYNQLEIYHSSNIIHGNIKPSNIMVDENYNYFLMDSCQYLLYDENAYCKTDIFTFLSPESLKSNEFCSKSDIWGLGCVLYYLLTGKIPYSSTDLYVLIKIINNCEIDLTVIEDKKYEEILKRIFKVNPYERITLKELMIEINRLKENDFIANNKSFSIIPICCLFIIIENDYNLFRLITTNYYIYPDKIFFPLIHNNSCYERIINKEKEKSDLFKILLYNLSWYYPLWYESKYNQSFKLFTYLSDGYVCDRDKVLINYSPYIAKLRSLKLSYYESKDWGKEELDFKYLTNLKKLVIEGIYLLIICRMFIRRRAIKIF